MDLKKEHRNRAKQILKEIDIDTRNNIQKKMQYYLVNSWIWDKNDVIGITISQNYEWNTREIIKLAWSHGKKVCIPKCYPTYGKLVFFELQSFDELEVGFSNLHEPIPDDNRKINKDKIDVMIVPGLVFDRKGYRIGYGGGYYDRYLNNFKGITLSLACSFQIVDTVPREPFDIPVNYLISEYGFLDN
ncbi:5-formyltetrahydrofolate cyclo-ligase [Aquibacillus rhizosphaerae]|uniref:5-formyltetrahydrofolate cyclo-ligase n=1 Tax=Aquibacillus rhizosphaerae TaxID=3051431 RepID=A0ABT7L6P9_9BACI|nr:5-formyltetrahydrofolate cyclo-ligase [Aquibacillus sp. LR5S19]MDL4841544.1 5-formyltetrahydrofolate cyclo-ligase [Aquibacillus sp. LR5S19]